jgi:hypothetical protein
VFVVVLFVCDVMLHRCLLISYTEKERPGARRSER